MSTDPTDANPLRPGPLTEGANMSRRVVANMSLSLDGQYAKHDPTDMGWVMPYAMTDVARRHLTDLWTPATTALLGRTNAEGFLGYWPTVIGAEGTDPRDEAFAQWLVDTRKVVLSSTLAAAPWERTSVIDKPAVEVVDDLRASEGGDILILSSASVIKPLLAADGVDRLALMVFPIFLGGGPRLFDDGLPAGEWTLTSQAAGEYGELSLVYDRTRG
jgi:dihydrofolate reductase